jgi:hypothetical protein
LQLEEVEACEDVLRQVQSRAKLLEAECLELQMEKQEADNEAEALYGRWRSAEQEALRYKRLYQRNQSHLNNAILEEVYQICLIFNAPSARHDKNIFL